MQKIVLALTALILLGAVSSCGPVGVAKTTAKTAGKVTVGTVRTAGRVAF